MKKYASKTISFMALIMLMTLSGCIKNEFKVSFEFPKDHVGNYIVTYYAWDSRTGAWIENTASVQDGTASVGCITRRPTLVYVRDASSAASSTLFYVERGDEILIKGDKNDMNTWSISGNDISRQWSEWRKTNAASLSGTDPVKTRKEREKAISGFVKANPSSLLSAIMLLTEWDRRENPEGFLSLWNSIDKDLRSQETTEMCGAPDLLGVEFEVKADGTLGLARKKKHTSLIVRSRDNGIDTLRLAGKKASLLYFFRDNDSRHRIVIDSLKAIAKEFPDSTKRIISDISAESDSTAWIAQMRGDTLKGAVRAWMPHGIADERMVSLGVARLPWIVVMSKGGSEVYSGDEVGEAVKAFRKEMKKKDNPTKPKKK